MFTRSNLLIVIALGILIIIVFALVLDANAQEILQPDLYLQLSQDENGYFMVCKLGCSWYNALGTPEEINKHFREYHCAVNWTYFLRNRYYGVQFLDYLVGPNGDISNPLCEQ